MLEQTLIGHSDAVWSLSYLGSRPQLLSASADGTVKLWQLSPSSSSDKVSTPPKTFGYAASNSRYNLLALRIHRVSSAFANYVIIKNESNIRGARCVKKSAPEGKSMAS